MTEGLTLLETFVAHSLIEQALEELASDIQSYFADSNVPGFTFPHGKNSHGEFLVAMCSRYRAGKEILKRIEVMINE